MKQYSFISEGSVDKILAVAGMTTLGSSVGDAVGGRVGEVASRVATRNLAAHDISWTDPIFVSIVRKDLVESQNKIKLAKEWYNSCDISDRARARMDYNNAVLEYKEKQRDIAERKADRWMDEYKNMLALNNSQRFAKFGKFVGGVGAFGGTAAKILKK